MKNFKNILHIMLTVVSVLGFLGGWATLAHARKPGQTTTTQAQVVDPLPPLDPIPDLGSSSTTTSNNNGLNIVVPPSNQDNSNNSSSLNQNNSNNSGSLNNSNNSSSLNNSNTTNNSNNTTVPARPSRRAARPLFTTTGS